MSTCSSEPSACRFFIALQNRGKSVCASVDAPSELTARRSVQSKCTIHASAGRPTAGPPTGDAKRKSAAADVGPSKKRPRDSAAPVASTSKPVKPIAQRPPSITVKTTSSAMRKTSSGTPVSAKPPTPAAAKAAPGKPATPASATTAKADKPPPKPLPDDARARILGEDAGKRAYDALKSAGLAAFEDLGDKSPSLRAIFAEVPWGDLSLVIAEHVVPEAKLDETQAKKLKRRLGDDYTKRMV